MKKYGLLLVLFAFVPLALQSQAETSHIKINNEFDFDYGNGWVADVTTQLVVNQVRKINNQGQFEIKYTNNYREVWNYYNTETGESRVSPGVQNVTGVFTPGVSNDRHWVTHYVKDPIFGTYHLNMNILWLFNTESGFLEIIDVQNEWTKS